VLACVALWLRRKFIVLLGGSATWPVLARAQQPAMPMIWYLNSCGSTHRAPARCVSLGSWQKRAMSRDKNVAIEYRLAEGKMIDCGR
jgi:putative ABC transport system substrate-binding protein